MFKFFSFITTLVTIYVGVSVPYIYANFILNTTRNIFFYLPIFLICLFCWRMYKKAKRKLRRSSW